MPVVVTCPACQQKAKVPEAMLGQSVKCPACAATFSVPAEIPPPAVPPPISASADPPERPPLPADADVLRSVRSGVGVQLVAQCLYALAICLALLLFLLILAEKTSAGTGFGRGNNAGSTIAGFLAAGAIAILLVGKLLDTVGAALCVLAPPAHLARGLAIAVLMLAIVVLLRTGETFGWIALAFQGAFSGGYGGARGDFWFAGTAVLWLMEIVRLSVLALFWQSASRVIRDARGATNARRLAIGGPILQVFIVFAWIGIASVGIADPEVEILAFSSWLVVQLLVVLAGVRVAARLWRRLKAVVPPGA